MKHYCPAEKRRMPEHELPCIIKKACSIKRCQFSAAYKILKSSDNAPPMMPFMMPR